MVFQIDASNISHGIQLAVAPVFLLTAVAGMIGVVANRLARIIDRARLVESHLDNGTQAAHQERFRQELRELRKRGLLANSSIGLLTLCAFLICATVVVLFLGETIDLPVLRWSIVSFLAALVCFMLSLLGFFMETLIATRLLNFPQTRVARER
jgi:hypothetical protein